jgi:hypothetical protein
MMAHAILGFLALASAVGAVVASLRMRKGTGVFAVRIARKVGSPRRSKED